MKMTALIVLIIILILYICFNICHLYHKSTHESSFSLKGGNVVTDGFNSYCIVNEREHKFIKYYIEEKDSSLITTPLYIIINNHILTLSYKYELDVLRVISNIKEVNTPKLYINECKNIPYDESIVANIRKNNNYDKDKSQLKILVMEYLPFITMKQFIRRHGVVVQDKQIVRNDIYTRIMIDVYTKFFTTIVTFIKHNVIPYDIENITNILVDRNNNLYIIDCANYLIIQDNNNTAYEDVFISYLYETYYTSISRSYNMIHILILHPDCRNILRQSLSSLISSEKIEYIINNFVNIDFETNKRKYYLIKSLLGDNDYRTNNYLQLLNIAITNRSLMKNIVNKCNTYIDNNMNYISSLSTHSDIQAFYHELHANFDELELQYIHLKLNNITMSDIYSDIIDVINASSNEVKTLFYDNSLPFIAYDNSNHDSTVQTNKYIPLTLDNANCSTHRQFTSNHIQTRYTFDARLCTKVDVIDTRYLVFNYDIEPFLVNWVGLSSKTHEFTNYGLKLYINDRNLYNQILNDSYTKTYEEVCEQYGINPLLMQSVRSIYKCTKKGIDISNEYTQLTSYINNHSVIEHDLYRGEFTYDINAYKVGDIIERKNIHTFTKVKEDALKFMNNEYHSHDSNIKDKYLLILSTAHVACIHTPVVIDYYCIMTNWTEYLHNEQKYIVTNVIDNEIYITEV